MYEDYEEIFVDEAGGSGAGTSVLSFYGDRDDIASVSGGDSGEYAAGSDGFDYDLFADVLSDALVGSVSGADHGGADQVVQEEIYIQLEEINTSVQGLYSLVTLICVYLLLDWTSRKLLAVVNRFTGRRK